MSIGEMEPLRNLRSEILEISPEVYEDLSTALKGASTICVQLKKIIPTYQHERLALCLAKAIVAIGRIDITSLEEDRENDPVAKRNDRDDRRYHERVDRELEERAP